MAEKRILEDGAFYIRLAEKKDTALILSFIKELAEYEKLAHEVKVTEKTLSLSLFDQKGAEVILAYWQERPVSYALFFHTYSTFLGKRGLFIEDLYVKPEVRGRGIGMKMMRALARVAKDRDCGRMEWWCLDWNKPSIGFYKRIGAKPMGEWMIFRMVEENIQTLL